MKIEISNIVSQCSVRNLGVIPYCQAYEIQKACVADVISGRNPIILLCEHPPVLTLGRLSRQENLLLSAQDIAERNIEVINIDRGGDVTLHAPGQLVIYPILNLNNYGRDLHVYIHKLEQVVIDLLASFGIVANRLEGKTGVWVKERKLASIGVGVKKWVSFHGIGINVNTDLELFKIIRPCGLDVQMTSIAQLKGRQDMHKIETEAIKSLSRIFNLEINL